MKKGSVHRAWTIADSLETYQVRGWGGDYFGINSRGDVCVLPENPGGGVDLYDLVQEVRRRGILPPLLIRFSEILHRRIIELNEAFGRAINEYGYKGAYRGVYPVKVNQDRYVLDEVVRAGRPYNYGLEAGTKPELLAVIALLEDPEALVICNGYKDEEYVETALMATKLGHNVVLVVEKMSELPLIADVSRRMEVKPNIGIRVRLSSRGAGRWESSAGDRAKFGLPPHEVMAAIDYLREQDLLSQFKLLHFHLGSQISAIRSVKNALREAGRFFVELRKLGAPLSYFDVGGGLGVDYDGSQTNFSSSMNYSLQEYANDVVYSIMEICDSEGTEHPIVVSESGRAVAAQHAVLVTEVLGVSEMAATKVPEKLPEGLSPVVENLHELHRTVSRKNFLEVYHDAIDHKEEALQLFSFGHLSLEERVLAENMFWSVCRKVYKIAREADEPPEELEVLERALADTYFLNFSLFQSLPDAWAVDHLFPVIPLHRHGEEPVRRGILADVTCDSDGKLDHFIDRREVKDTLELHSLKEDPYYLGVFLVGAYQESLGDLHNLFGNTNVLVVSTQPDGGYRIEHVEPGDTVTDVLQYACYNRSELIAKMRRSCEESLRRGQITLDESREIVRMYEGGLNGYTYLERE